MQQQPQQQPDSVAEGVRPGPAGVSSMAALAGATVAYFHARATSAGGAVAGATNGRACQVGKTLTNLAAANNNMTLPLFYSPNMYLPGTTLGMFLSSHAAGKCAQSSN